MRLLYGVCGLLLGCSSPAPNNPNIDAGVDAPCNDTDGDGACDSVDTCPDLANPTQLDPDGDGIGWACDPVETFSFDTIGPVTAYRGSISSKGVIVHIAAWIFGTNQSEEVIAAGDPTSLWIARSTSTDPADAWTQNHTFEKVLVTADHQLLASRRQLNNGDTRAIDPTTKTTDVRGPILANYLRAGTGTALLVSVGQQLTEPRNGSELHTIATAPANGEWFTTFGVTEVYSPRFATDPVPFVASRITSSAMGWSLQRFMPGANALTDLTPPVSGVREVARLREERGSPWCVRESTTASLYQPTSQGITITPTSLHTCAVSSYAFPNTELLIGWSTDVNNDNTVGTSAVFVRNGVSYDIFHDLVGPQDMRPVAQSRDVIVLEGIPFQNGDASAVYVIWPDNTVQLLSDDLAYTDVSIGDDTVHVVGTLVGAPINSSLRLRRLKQGQSVQNITLDPQVGGGSGARVITTAEGAALVNLSGGITWIASSTSTTATTYPNLVDIAGGTRRGHTVVMTGVIYGSGVTTGAAWAYDEVAGQPRLTRLSDNASGFNGALADMVGPQQSEYFAFYGPVCHFGRIRPVNGVPALESSPCAFEQFAELKAIGVTPQGETLIAADTFNAPNGVRLSALSEAGVRNIGKSMQMIPVFDRSTTPPTMVAWYARNNFDGYVCVEESPLRCWAVPGQMHVIDTRIDGGVVSLLLYLQEGTKQTFSVVRTVGPGDATLP